MFNIHEAIRQYMNQYPPIKKKHLKFADITNLNGDIAIIPVEAGTENQVIMFAGKFSSYVFYIVSMRSVSKSTDKTNVENMKFINEFQDWIEEQNNQKIYPDFGDQYQVLGIFNLPDNGSLAQKYDNGVGKYMFAVEVKFYKKGATY